MFNAEADHENDYFWVRDELEEYLPVRRYPGTVEENEEITFEVFITGKIVKKHKSLIVGQVPPPGNISLTNINEDLVENDDISEASVMWSIKKRFFADKIYSAIGPIIIAINPYRHIPEVYSSETLDIYKNSGSADFSTTPPHIWRIAHGAYVKLRTRKVRQAIVISGESGAGKTETTKKCLQYLSALAQYTARYSTSHSEADSIPIEDRVLGTNPLLESFGNSKTARNDNSSRFGKWLEIHFEQSDHLLSSSALSLIGASITQYLLEKSRVVFQSDGERNYHIFYQIFTDAKHGLGDMKDYNYLNQSGCVAVKSIDDAAEYELTMKAFDKLMFSDNDREAIIDALKAVLFLGNIGFESDAADSSRTSVTEESQRRWLRAAADALTVDADELALSLSTRVIYVRGEKVETPLLVPQAVDTRNALAKEIYGRIFCQIVDQANESLRPDDHKALGRPRGDSNAQSMTSAHLCCGLLDIFGFELLQCNSFEQLCINFANEKLQQYFLQFVLKKEQDIYDAEGIEVAKVIPKDNEDVLHLIEAKSVGILARLDEEVKIPKGTDAGFLSKVEHDHNKKTKESRFFRDVKMKQTQFEVRHFAGVVRYESKGFLDKNKDRLFDHLEDLLSTCSNYSLRYMMELHGPKASVSNVIANAGEIESDHSSGASPRKRSSSLTSKTLAASREKNPGTLATRFQTQLNQLIQVLTSSDAHFVRCIKPNSTKSAHEMESGLVLRQLQYSGVLEAIQIRKTGYPTRRTLVDFRRSYWMLSGISLAEMQEMSEVQKCNAIVSRLAALSRDWIDIKVGRTLVFFRPETLHSLELQKLERGKRAVLFIQSCGRMLVAGVRFMKLANARMQLREVIERGHENNASNIDILPELKRFTHECEVVTGLTCIEIKYAHDLIRRLEQVEACRQRMVALLKSSTTEEFASVLEEYEAVTSVLSEAAEMGINFPQMVDLRVKKEMLEERGEALIALRDAIANRDDGSLRQALRTIAVLNTKYGVFCPADEEEGERVYKILMAEITMIEEGLKYVTNFHAEYHSRREKLDENDLWHWAQSSLVDYNSGLEAVVSPFEKESPSAPMAKLILEIFKNVIRMRRHWMGEEWGKVAFNINQMKSSAKDISTFSKPTSQVMQLRGTELVKALEMEIGLVRSELDLHMILPLLASALESGRLVANSFGDIDDVSVARVTVDNLHATVADIKKVEWCGPSVQALLGRAELIAAARQAVMNSQWDSLLTLTEPEERTHQRRRRLRDLESQFKKLRTGRRGGDGNLDDSSAPLTGLINDIDCSELWMMFVESANKISGLQGSFHEEVEKIESEIYLIRQLSFQMYCQFILQSSMSIGNLCTESDRVDEDDEGDGVSSVHGRAIQIALAEVERLQEEGFYGPLGDTLSHIIDNLSQLMDARLKFSKGEFNEINELLGENSTWDILQTNLAVSKYSGKSLAFLDAIRSESGRILTLAKNEMYKANLRDRLSKSGSIGGTIGDLNVERCNVNELMLAIKFAEEYDKGGEFGGMSESLMRLIEFCKALVAARKCYLINHSMKEKKECVARLSEAVEGLESSLPPHIVTEAILLRSDIAYTECRDSLQQGLKLQAPVHYVIAAPLPPSGSSTGIVVEDEEVQLNYDVLETEKLETGLEIAARIRSSINQPLPQELNDLVETCELVRSMRLAVQDLDWATASTVFAKLKNGNYAMKIPIIAEELIGCESPIINYLNINTCKAALSTGQPDGPVGWLDGSTAKFDALDAAIELGQSNRNKSPAAYCLFRAVLAVAELRRAQRANDWGVIKSVLRQVETDKLGHGVTRVCYEEIKRAETERDNYDAVFAMKQALVYDCVRAQEGVMHCDYVSTEKLAAACEIVHEMNVEHRGDVTVQLLHLSETVLKARAAAVSGNAFLLRSLLPVWLREIDIFRGVIEGTESDDTQRRRSMVGRKPAQRTAIAIAVESSERFRVDSQAFLLPETQQRLYMRLYDEFSEVFDTMEKEVAVIEHHFVVQELEIELLKALQEGGITAEMIGQVDHSAIKTDGIKAAITKKTSLDMQSLPIPQALQHTFKAAHLILEMRSAISKGMWESLPSLIEESVTGLSGPVPEVCRDEIQVIRHEVENQWIITNLTEALHSARIEGDVGNIKLGNIAFEALERVLSTSQMLTPRTLEAQALVLNADFVVPLRKMLCDDPINWFLIREMVDNLLAGPNMNSLHSVVLPELRLLQATAEDTILCKTMEVALSRGGPSGEPGHVDLTSVTTVELASTCNVVIETAAKTERALELWNVCRTVKMLREALIRTRDDDEQTTAEAEKSIRSLIGEIFKTFQANATDISAWSICREEVLLVTKDAHIKELNQGIDMSVTKSLKIYENRSKMGIAQKARKASVLMSTAETQLPCKDLDRLIDYAEKMEFKSELLEKYTECAKYLRKLRSAINVDDWATLQELVNDEAMTAQMDCLPITKLELEYARQESNNYQVIESIEKALMRTQSPLNASGAERRSILVNSDSNHTDLAKAIEAAEGKAITSVTAKQLLECAKTTLLLRRGLSNQISKDVATALRWFKANAHRCPVTTQHEAQRAYIIHQNDLLYVGLINALSTGTATGQRGALDVSTIQVQSLYKLLQQAKDVKHQTAAVKELIEAGEIIYVLRCALQIGDIDGVARALSLMADQKIILPLIIDEVASARAEVENMITIRALTDALAAFHGADLKSLEISLNGAQQLVNQVEASMQSSFGVKSRRYSYENRQNPNIDTSTIEVGDLEDALEMARDHGILSDRARILYRTALIVRTLRVAMKMCDWGRVEDTLVGANLAGAISNEQYDPVANREIQVIQSQLTMRKSIVDLTKALKVGWANCSNGIVDTSCLVLDDLNIAIEQAVKSLTGLGFGSSGGPSLNQIGSLEQLVQASLAAKKLGPGSSDGGAGHAQGRSRAGAFRGSLEETTRPVPALEPRAATDDNSMHQQVELLIDSARLVATVRGYLKKRDLELAGMIAEEGLQVHKIHNSVKPELQLYATEINRALRMMNLCLELRNGMAKGDLETLEPLIVEAKRASMHLSNDLGLVRMLELAQIVYKSFLASRVALVKLGNNYSAVEIQRTIDRAVAINISGFLIDNAKKRLAKLKEFEALVDDLRKASGGALRDEHAFKAVIELAHTLGMRRHPAAMRAEILLKLSAAALRTTTLAEAVRNNLPHVAATETIRLKRSFLAQENCQKNFELEKFARLRRPEDFGMRVSLGVGEIQGNMLTHTYHAIPTSLTRQSPPVAALAVWIFSHCIHGIERLIYSRVEVLLRNIIILGRNCVSMRDELLLQIVKQLRGNSDTDATDRLWRTLGACLSHFPPSKAFENYLETFLISETEREVRIGSRHDTRKKLNSQEAIPASPAAKQCIRFMHETIFTHGYDKPILINADTSLKTIAGWLGDGYSRALNKTERINNVGMFGSPFSLQPPSQPKGSIGSSFDTFDIPDDSTFGDILSPTAGTSAPRLNASTVVEVPRIPDPAFADISLPGASVTRSAPLTCPSAMRGTRENWIDRFSHFRTSGGASNASGGGGAGGAADKLGDMWEPFVSMEMFMEALSFSSPSMDKLDKDLLLYLITGKIPERRTKILRELRCDANSFMHANEKEATQSAFRREWLRKHVAQALPVHSSLIPLKPADRKALAKEFWSKVVARLVVEASTQKGSGALDGPVTMNWEMYRELVLAGMELLFEVDREHRITQFGLESGGGGKSGAGMSGQGGAGGGGGSGGLGFNFEGFIMYSVNEKTGKIEVSDRRNLAAAHGDDGGEASTDWEDGE